MLKHWFSRLWENVFGRSALERTLPTRLSLELLEDRTVPATFVVTSAANDGLGSLRAAVTALVDPANTDTSNDIAFDPELVGTITLTEALPVIDKSVVIMACPPERPQTIGIVRDQNAARFGIFSFVGPEISVTICGLRMEGADSAGNGGAISARLMDQLNILDCFFYQNEATRGAAVYAFGVHEVTILRTQFSNNTSVAAGGAVEVNGAGTRILRIQDSEFAGNTAGTDGGALYTRVHNVDISDTQFVGNRAVGGAGGAIYVQSLGAVILPNQRLNIRRGLFSNNIVGFEGGAIYNAGAPGLIEGCLFDENQGTQGGAIDDPQGALDFASSTMTGNSATDIGGAVHIDAEAARQPTFVNCIIWGNAANGGADVYGDVNSLGHNLIGDDSESTGWVVSDIIDQDPLLSSLGYHGGKTQSRVLLASSPALDAGDDGYASTTDERGKARIVGSAVDMGAVEMQSGETSLVGPFAYDVTFDVSYNGSLNVPTFDGDNTLLDYSGNDPAEVEIVEVDGLGANVGERIETAEGGHVTLNADGTFLYEAPEDFVGTDYFTYMIDDGENTETGTVTLHITSVTANDTEYTLLVNDTLSLTAPGLLANAFAASGEALSITEVDGHDYNVGVEIDTASLDGLVTVDEYGNLTYVPDEDFDGDDSFTVTYSDGIESVTCTVTIHVVNLLASDAEHETPHLDELNVLANAGLLTHAADADDDTLSVFAVDGDEGNVDDESTTANGGTLFVNADGSFTYTAAAGFAGLDWFSYTVTDGDDHYSTAWVVIDVTSSSPTDITLSNDTIVEAQANDATVGSFSATDADTGETFTYTLVEGDGDDDNDSFTIDGNTLKAAETFDYEGQTSYSIRVQVADATGLTYEKVFTIDVLEANSLEFNGIDQYAEVDDFLDLTSSWAVACSVNFSEATSSGRYFSMIAQDATEVASFEVQWAASDDVNGNDLRIACWATDAIGSYVSCNSGVTPELGEWYRVYAGYDAVSEQLEIYVNGVLKDTASFTTPWDSDGPLTLGRGWYNGVQNDFLPGKMASVKIYTSAPNDTDAASDYANAFAGTNTPEADVWLKLDGDGNDSSGNSHDATFYNDPSWSNSLPVYNTPTDISLSANTVLENQPVLTIVGTFGVTDDNVSEGYTYIFVSGLGSDDNDMFTIVGNTLKTAEEFDYETKSSYSIRVRVTDSSGLFYDEIFTIDVIDEIVE